MTGQTTGSVRPSEGMPLEPIDADSAARIDVHLERALAADDAAEKDFHVRHARQLLAAASEN
jgi:hypothetical protein